jgi:hypothetical protein
LGKSENKDFYNNEPYIFDVSKCSIIKDKK